MRRSQDAGGISPRLVLAAAFGALLAGALILSLRASGSVMLLHVGYSEQSEQGDGGRDPIFCLTNGTRKPIAYSGNSRGAPSWWTEVRTNSSWSYPNAFHWTYSFDAPPNSVLRPGQSVVFRGGSPQTSSAWRAGVTYWPCKVRDPKLTTTGNMISGSDASTGIRGFDGIPFLGPGIEPERTLMQRVQAKIPKLAPAWLKGYVDSRVRDPVAWGPEMN